MPNSPKSRQALLLENENLKRALQKCEKSEVARQQTENKLRNVEHKYRLLTKNLPVGGVSALGIAESRSNLGRWYRQ